MLVLKLTLLIAIVCSVALGNGLEVLPQFEQKLAKLKADEIPFMYKASTVRHWGETYEVPTIYTPSSVVHRLNQGNSLPPTSWDVERSLQGVRVFKIQTSHYVVTPAQHALLTAFWACFHIYMQPRQAAVFDYTFKEWFDYLILHGYTGQLAILNRPADAVHAILTSQRTRWYELDDQGNRHLSWWNNEYQNAQEAGSGQSSHSSSIVNRVRSSVQSLRDSLRRHDPRD